MSGLAGKSLGRYHLLEQIGFGGVATVYRALDLERQEEVAVKVLSSHLAATSQFRQRFAREVKVLSRLKHPHIVPILDFGEFDEQPYIVVPYYPAGTLADRIQAGPLTPAEGSRIVGQVAGALEFAHHEGVVHRDLKPSNILLDGEQNAYLADFGFAQTSDASLSLTGSGMVGTPAYMSPEQCKGDPVGPRSDQYSMGVVLHQLATGRLPFTADTPMGIAIKHVHQPLTPPSRISPQLPRAIEQVLIRAMAKDPEDRFASVAQLNQAFQTALADSLNPAGELIPQAIAAGEPTLPLPQPAIPASRPGGPRRGRRRLALLIVLGAMVLVPSAWAMLGAVQRGFWAAASATPPGPTMPNDLMATISAMSTELAQRPGEAPPSSEEIATAVAATLSAQGASGAGLGAGEPGIGSPEAPQGFLGASQSSRTATPTRTRMPGVSGASPTPTPTPSLTLPAEWTRSPTVTQSPEVPTITATWPASATPTAAASLTAAPSSTPLPPTSTAAPPTPIPPDRCQKHPHQANYCTPTPSP